MKVTVWYSSESMADYIIDHTVLRKHRCTKRKLQESDASKPAEFHAVPDHIKRILYLDAPDIIVEVGSNPVFTIEESKEAGTGHNAFQRFSRLANVTGVGNLLLSRPKTVAYLVNAKFRGDPYPGALAAIDYMKCRVGRTFEDREYNLVMIWGTADVHDGVLNVSGQAAVNDFCERLMNIDQHNLLTKTYAEVKREKKLPRYYMQARYGSMFSKAKDIRVYSYFCDAILFSDGVLWREG